MSVTYLARMRFFEVAETVFDIEVKRPAQVLE